MNRWPELEGPAIRGDLEGNAGSIVPAGRPEPCEHCGVPLDSAAHWWFCATLRDDEGEGGGR